MSSKETYYAKMSPYATRVADALDMPVEVILAQWGHETGYGTSDLSKRANNHAGIKSNSRGRDYVSGIYAGYNSLDSFARDYIRVMKLPYYDKVRAAKNINDTIVELHKSPWATDPEYGKKLFAIIGGVPTVSTGDRMDIINESIYKVNNMSNEDLVKYASIGVGALLLVGFFKD